MIIPVGFFFAAAAFYVTIAYTTGNFSRWVGIVLLSTFALYMVVTVLQMKRSPVTEISEEVHEESDESSTDEYSSLSLGKKILAHLSGKKNTVAREIILLVIGAAVIAFGANLLVNNGTAIAEKVGVPESVIALTFVALGTSLPELVTAITSLVKGHGSLSLGNIIGANLFNLVLVSGVAVTISPFPIPSVSQIGGINASLIIDLPVMLGVMLIMTVPALISQKLSRVQGILLLCIYAAFCAVQFIM